MALHLLEQDQEYINLQTELVWLQQHIKETNQRVLILFEGRDTAGKGGAIMRFIRFLNPRLFKVVALSKPTEKEEGQWYFQRYIEHLPGPGEMVLFDRSWYNRAVVEPVMGFCSKKQYSLFNPLKHWKLSSVDVQAQSKWEEFTFYKEAMFKKTAKLHAPWVVVKGNDRDVVRKEVMRYVVNKLEYDKKGLSGERLSLDNTIVSEVFNEI